MILYLDILIQYRHVTDGQTDGLTDGNLQHTYLSLQSTHTHTTRAVQLNLSWTFLFGFKKGWWGIQKNPS